LAAIIDEATRQALRFGAAVRETVTRGAEGSSDAALNRGDRHDPGRAVAPDVAL
jgi:hypothetical protein